MRTEYNRCRLSNRRETIRPHLEDGLCNKRNLQLRANARESNGSVEPARDEMIRTRLAQSVHRTDRFIPLACQGKGHNTA
jgi:hypothetical protein